MVRAAHWARWITGLIASAVLAQTGAPQFTLPQRFLQPGQFLEIYGTALATSSGCNELIPQNGPNPHQACGVLVTAGGLLAGLLYVSPTQINIKLPENLPDGEEPVQVCVRDLCSAPVTKDFSSHTAFLHIQEPAYIGMPVWVDIELPSPYRISYPCRADPWDFRSPSLDRSSELLDYKLELRREGVPVEEAAPPDRRVDRGIQKDPPCMIWFNGLSRLPLHLAYKLDSPGLYSIRLTGSRGPEIVVQSAWTDVEIQASSEAARDEWLRSMAAKAQSAHWDELLRDVVPSLIAQSDAKALSALVPLYLEWLGRRGAINNEIYLIAFLRNSLAAFDDSVLRRVIPFPSLSLICPPQGDCKHTAPR